MPELVTRDLFVMHTGEYRWLSRQCWLPETHAAGTKDTRLLADMQLPGEYVQTSIVLRCSKSASSGMPKRIIRVPCDTPNMGRRGDEQGARVHSLTAFCGGCRGYLRARNLFERMGDSMRGVEMTRDIVQKKLDRNDVAPDSPQAAFVPLIRFDSDRILSDYPMWAADLPGGKKKLIRPVIMDVGGIAFRVRYKRCGMIFVDAVSKNSGNYRTVTEY